MASQYIEEAEAQVAEEINMPNNPLFIPPNRNLSFAYEWRMIQTGDEGHANRAFEPLLTVIQCKIQNYRYTHTQGYGPVDNNVGSLIRNCYDNAFLLARRRFNFTVPNLDHDDRWVETHETATQMNFTNVRFATANTPILAGERYPMQIPTMRRGQYPFSMVKVNVDNMPSSRGELEDERWPMASDNVHIRPSDPVITCRRLYTSLASKFFFAQSGVRQKGSGAQLVFPPIYENSILVTFHFMFVKDQRWTPLQGNYSTTIVKQNNYRAPEDVQADAIVAGGGGAGAGIVQYPPDYHLYEDDNNDQYVPPAGNYTITTQRRNQASSSVNIAPPSRRLSAPIAVRVHARKAAAELGRGPFTVTSSGRVVRPPTRYGYFGGKDDTSLYAKMKEKIYIRRHLGDFFTHSKACISVPTTEEQMCIPMAIMRCQRRVWTRKVEMGEICNEMESIEEDEATLFNIEVDEDLPEESRPPNDLKTSFFDGKYIHVFDCRKKEIRRQGSHGKTLYLNEATDLDADEIALWKWCAQQVHYFVEEICGQSIHMQDLDMCLAAYSHAFQVNISIFAMEMKGERISIQHVNTREILEKDGFIGLITQNTHVHAISNMRHYHRSQVNPAGTCLHSYCDYCNTLSYCRDKSHASKCSQSDWKITASLDTLHQEEAAKLEIRAKFNLLPSAKRSFMMCSECCLKDENCICPPTKVKSVYKANFIQCKTCLEEVPMYHFNKHDCYMKARKPKERLKDESIFVYDIESMQTYNDKIDQYVHECILVCLRAVYDDRKWKFDNIPQFVNFLLDSPEMHGSTILAHNGGGYDHQFVLRYLEDNGIMHTTTPRPNTLHKYLMVEISMLGDKTAIKFLDFMMMMTDSLRNIGKAFKLNVCKGDFPHKFSREEHLEYNGPLPELDSEKDWFGFKEIKNPEELHECREYWEKQATIFCTCKEDCTCTKPKWNFKNELEKYCWLDVDVLAGACKAYRDQALNFNGSSDYSWSTAGIEPFQYMTQSQIALALFMQGKEQNNIAITHEKIRYSFRPNQILWFERLMKNNPNYKIQHAGNSFKEFYDIETKTFVDGYCPRTKTVFEYLDCELDGCPTCYAQQIASKSMNLARGLRWDLVASQTRSRLITLQNLNNYNSVITRWAHEDEQESYPEFSKSLGNVMRLRDFFYGGRTEVFAAYANPSKFPNMELLHHDVCSLYPYVCSWKDLPMGVPQILFHETIDRARLNPNHPNAYFGFARIRVKPNTKDLIAVLPQRLKAENGDEKLMYDLHEKEGCWHTELIYLAMERQYEILDIYEVWHWDKNQRSATLMRGYMEFFLRMKQEAEGWGKLGKDLIGNKPESEITDEDKDKIAEMIYQNNGGFARPRKEKVDKNPVLRQLAKIFLNCLWGKLCQKNAIEYERFIYGYKQYIEIMGNCLVNSSTLKFRHVNGCVFKVRYELLDTLQESNRFLNIPIAASVTAHAQVVLMRQMFRIGPERILYCDTDSIFFLREKGAPLLNRSGLGNWEDEHPGEVISKFWALAPKCYMMELIDHDESVDYHFKCKGVRSTEENRKRTTYEKIHELIEAEFQSKDALSIIAKTMTIHPNSTNATVPYGTLCTRYGDKVIQVVFSKRWMLKNTDPRVSMDDFGIVRLLPFGYDGDIQNTL